MPNYCNNILSITGPSTDIERFLRLSTGKSDPSGQSTYLDFNLLIPCPKELLEVSSPVRVVTQQEFDESERKGHVNTGITQERHDALKVKYGAASWYDWCCDNWGTKWGSYDVQEWDRSTDRTCSTSYNSAWAPPTKGLQKISEMFPELVFENSYMEPGMAFCGNDIIKNGEILESCEMNMEDKDGLSFCESVFGYEPEPVEVD